MTAASRTRVLKELAAIASKWSRRDWWVYASEWRTVGLPNDRAAPLLLSDALRRSICEITASSTKWSTFVADARAVIGDLDAASMDGMTVEEILDTFATALWHDHLPARLTSSLSYPAIPEVVVEPLAAVLSGTVTFQAEKGRFRVLRTHHEIGDVVSGTRRRQVDDLASAAAHRLVRFLVGEVWVRGVAGETSPNELIVDHGWKGLSDQLGMSSRHAADDLKRAGEVLSRLRLDAPLGRSRLLTIGPSYVGPSRSLVLRAEGPLSYGYVRQMKAKKAAQRKLVPLPPVPPPLTGHRRSHPQQLSFELLLLRRLRLAARRPSERDRLFHAQGDPVIPRPVATLDPRVIAADAAAVGLHARVRDELLDLWTSPAAEGGWLARALNKGPKQVYIVHGTAELANPLLLDAVNLQDQGRARRKRGKKKASTAKHLASAVKQAAKNVRSSGRSRP